MPASPKSPARFDLLRKKGKEGRVQRKSTESQPLPRKEAFDTPHFPAVEYGFGLIPEEETKARIFKLQKKLHQIEETLDLLDHNLEVPIGAALITGKDSTQFPCFEEAITLRDGSLRRREGLRTERARVCNQINRFTNALAPWQRRLPPELIRLIFLHCLEGGVQIPPKTFEAPLLLCQVCSAWRHVALRTPRLWDNITISRPSFYNPLKGLSTMEIAKAWYSRANGSLLHLTVNPSSLERPLEDPMEGLVIPLSNRFRSFHLTLSRDNMEHLFAFPSGSLGQLEEFSLFLDRPIPEWTYSLTAFQSSCSLIRAEFDIGYTVNPCILNLPWNQLTHLCFVNTRLNPHFCMPVLRLCTSLQACKINILPVDDFIAVADIYLHNLHTFSVQFSNAEVQEEFLMSVTLPSLRSLRLECTTAHPRLIRSYIDLILRSSCRMQELDLGDIPGSTIDSSVYSLIMNSPSLKSLTLPVGVSLNSLTLRRMAEGSIGPCLEHLKLDGIRDPGPLITMMERRLETDLRISLLTLGLVAPDEYVPSQLKSVTIYTRQDQIRYDNRVLKLIDKGTNIVFITKCI